MLLSTEYFWLAIIYSKFVYSSKVSPDTKLLHRLHMEKDEVYGTVIVSKLLRDYYRKYFWCMDLTTGTGIIHNPFRFMIRYLVLPGRTGSLMITCCESFYLMYVFCSTTQFRLNLISLSYRYTIYTNRSPTNLLLFAHNPISPRKQHHDENCPILHGCSGLVGSV